MRKKTIAGFTISELLVVIFIITLILGIVIPRLNRSSTGTKLKTTTQSIAGVLETAKSYAQAQGVSCAVLYDPSGGHIAMVIQDIDDANNNTNREELIEFDRGITVPSGLTIDFTADNTVTFNPYGGVGNADEVITVTAESIHKTKTITVNRNTGFVAIS